MIDNRYCKLKIESETIEESEEHLEPFTTLDVFGGEYIIVDATEIGRQIVLEGMKNNTIDLIDVEYGADEYLMDILGSIISRAIEYADDNNIEVLNYD